MKCIFFCWINLVHRISLFIECLDVELNSRLDIGKGFFICIALSKYNTLDADGIGNITVRMLFYYYFYWLHLWDKLCS